ncbi:MAG: peptide ABC transporter substrate-binding protein [Chloroflexi bacterium]|nr:peptide ABC transporter substrate-binding protein [Chloroflexota bacterium]
MPSRKHPALYPRSWYYPWFGFLILVLVLSACQARTATPTSPKSTQTPAGTNVSPTSISPTAAPTAEPRSLVVCLGQEPQSLYIYGSAARDMWNVLEAIYDGPIDTRNYVRQPVILQKLPTLADGDAVIQPVKVEAGDDLVDANGNLSSLVKGVKLIPSACTSADCAVAWDGKSPVQMDQLITTYKLKPGITWSDGILLTAADSVYSYQLAADPATPTSKRMVDRTASYAVVDDLTVRWTGIPGYLPQQYDTNFWLPLPKHAWESIQPADLLKSEQVTRRPIGWGPYKIDEWVAGDHITLSKNPSYFRSSEGLPKFDKLVFRFPGQPADNNLAALLAGECDLVDQTALQDAHYDTVFDLVRSKKAQVFPGQGPEWEHLDFGIKPASYDDYYSPGVDRPDFFGDANVRKAFAYCIDRQAIAKDLMDGQVDVPASYLPPYHPLYLPDLQPLPHDVQAGAKLLDEAGWKDTDNNPATPRQAVGVKGITGGTPFTLTYLTTKAPLRLEIAKRLTASLGECGIQVDVKTMTDDELYAAGPDGPLFGRKFDLAEFAWNSNPQPPCFLYETEQTPTTANNWLTGNITGYSNPAYDAACKLGRLARPDQPDVSKQAYQDGQRILADDLPSIPLFFHLKLVAARLDLCGFTMDVTARSDLWNLENLDYGKGCR